MQVARAAAMELLRVDRNAKGGGGTQKFREHVEEAPLPQEALEAYQLVIACPRRPRMCLGMLGDSRKPVSVMESIVHHHLRFLPQTPRVCLVRAPRQVRVPKSNESTTFRHGSRCKS